MYNVISIIVLVVSYHLFKKVAGGTLRLTQINIYSYIFWIPLFSLSFLGINVIANSWLPFFHYSPIVINMGYFSVVYSMIVIPLSMLFIGNLLKFNPYKDIKHYSQQSVRSILSNEDSYVWFPMLLFTFLGIWALFYGYSQLENIPILKFLEGSSAIDLLKYRIEASRNFMGIVQIKNMLADNLLPLLSYIAFAYIYSRTKRKERWLMLFILLFFFSLLIKLFTLAKIPPITYILSFLPLLVIIKGRISKRTVAIFGAVFILSLLFVYISIAKMTSANEYLSFQTGPVARILFVQIQGLFEHFALFPEKIEFLNGASFPSWISGLFGKTHLTSARAVMEYLYPEAVRNGTIGVMNTHFSGEAWANFGYPGVIIAPIYVGIIIQLIFIYFYRMPKDPINIGLMNYSIIYLGNSIVGGFVAFVYSAIILFIILAIFIIRQLANRSAQYKWKKM